MSKPRTPDTIEHALTIILAELGEAVCEKIIGKSASLIRKASDPDHDFMLNLHQALALDRAYHEKTGETPPIMRVWMREMENIQLKSEDVENSIINFTLELHKEMGDCSDHVRQFTAPSSQSGRRLSKNEAVSLMQELDRVERTAAHAKETLLTRINPTHPTKGK